MTANETGPRIAMARRMIQRWWERTPGTKTAKIMEARASSVDRWHIGDTFDVLLRMRDADAFASFAHQVTFLRSPVGELGRIAADRAPSYYAYAWYAGDAVTHINVFDLRRLRDVMAPCHRDGTLADWIEARDRSPRNQRRFVAFDWPSLSTAIPGFRVTTLRPEPEDQA